MLRYDHRRMKLLAILRHAKPAMDALPAFIREIHDIQGVRVIRLRGAVGMQIGHEAEEVDGAAARSEDVFCRPLLFDFKDTTAVDFSTVAYLVQALRRRMPAHAQVGIINAPATLIAELDMARLDTLFKIFDSEELAIAELSRSVAAWGS